MGARSSTTTLAKRMTTLADSVLPLIRTRADLHRWSASNEHGWQMHDAVDILEAAIPHTDPAEIYSVTNAALSSALKVIIRADDSSGIIGAACRRLLAIHPTAAAAAQVTSRKLVEWMMKFQFEGEVDYFELDPVDYAPALGTAGMAAYRACLDEVRAALEPVPASADPWAMPDRHERFVLDWNDRRLAVFDHDVDAIIRTHARDRKVAAWLHDAAKAFEEIGEIDLAIDWAHQASNHSPGHQALTAAEYWCDLLATHRPTEELAARHEVFLRWPSTSTGAHLHRAAGSAWPGLRDGVIATLSCRPDQAVLFSLLTLHDAPFAWEQAHALRLDSDQVWAELATAYEKVDRLAVLPVHRRLVEHELVDAGAQHYRLAARRLRTMRKLAAGSAQASEVDEYIAALRETHRRRPRLQQEFDKVGLP